MRKAVRDIFVQIKMRKDLGILVNKYKIPAISLANEFGIPLNTLRDFIRGRNLCRKNFLLVEKNFKSVMDEFKKSINYAGFDKDIEKPEKLIRDYYGKK